MIDPVVSRSTVTPLKDKVSERAPGMLVIRADATVEIGNGHVMRCLALAQGWQDQGGAVHFLCADLPASLAEALLAQQFQVTRLPFSPGGTKDADAVSEYATDSAWIVVDGDLFSSEYVLRLKTHPPPVLLIDDYGARKNLLNDVVLNQNFNAKPGLYEPSASKPLLLLGTEYLLLRREFRRLARRVDVQTTARKIIVSLGGTDPDNLSLRVASACDRLQPGEFLVNIATTSANPHLRQLRERCLATPASAALLVDAPNIAEVMANSDLAVIASGGTLWELLYLGCPVLSYSRNQAQSQLVSDIAASGAIGNMGAVEAFDEAALVSTIERLAASPHERQSMSEAGARIVDGYGVNRVIECLLQARKVTS